MSASSISALQTEVARARELMGSPTTEEWAAASGRTGWSVQGDADAAAPTLDALNII